MTQAKIILKSKESMTVNLDAENAPISVQNFIDLASSGFYEGLIFHRVIPGFMIQGGGMDEKMKEKIAPKTVKGEFSSNGVPNKRKHVFGTISMARTYVPDSASSQFFICVADTPHLDGSYAAFGELADEESRAVALKLSAVYTRSAGRHDDVPLKPIVIDRVEIVEA